MSFKIDSMKNILTVLFLSYLLIGCKTQENVPVKEDPPTVITKVASDISTTTATLNGEVTNEGFSSASDRGFTYSDKNSNFSGNDSRVQVGSGKGLFSITLDKLQVNTNHFFRVYATNTKGTAYGEVQSFTTADYKLPTVITDVPKNITYTTVELGGSVTDEGGGTVSESGFVVGTNASPAITDLKFPVTKGKATIALIVSKLNVNTKYFVRSYAINEKGIAYGNEQSFTTPDYSLASISTDVPKNITTSTVEIFSTISNEGGGSVSERGFCLGLNANPTVSDNKLPVSSKGAGTFSLVVTSLKENTKYFIRSYAINEKGVAYGNEQNFTTLNYELPTLKTELPKNITYSSAELSGSVIQNGGLDISESGFVYGLNSLPTLNDIKIISVNVLNSNVVLISNLKEKTKYYVRAYAINKKGVGYGNEQVFSTIEIPVVKSLTGRIWMDRNLGANRVASSMTDKEGFGDLYQWGRGADGHQLRTSAVIYYTSNTDTPGHGFFIVPVGTLISNDWRIPKNDNLWQGVNGINNPCPPGYRLPTAAEWEVETSSWSSQDGKGAFNSPLKLPMAGLRYFGDGGLGQANNGTRGLYWSSTIGDLGYPKGITKNGIFDLLFLYSYPIPGKNLYLDAGSGERGYGKSCRCIKD